MTEQIITTVTRDHSIKVVDGHLTIEGDQKTLTPDETEQLLDVLLIWRYGLEAVSRSIPWRTNLATDLEC